MKLIKPMLIAAALFVGLFVQAAQAQSCQALLNDLINHASTQNGNDNYVAFKMVGNRGASDWAQYAEGELRYTPPVFNPLFGFRPARFRGEATQFFSDRLWYEPAPPGSFGLPGHPFNPYATDKLRISFDLGFLSPTNGHLTYTLLSWGNASATVEPKCEGDYMYAFLNDQMLVFSFKKVSFRPPH